MPRRVRNLRYSNYADTNRTDEMVVDAITSIAPSLGNTLRAVIGRGRPANPASPIEEWVAVPDDSIEAVLDEGSPNRNTTAPRVVLKGRLVICATAANGGCPDHRAEVRIEQNPDVYGARTRAVCPHRVPHLPGRAGCETDWACNRGGGYVHCEYVTTMKEKPASPSKRKQQERSHSLPHHKRTLMLE